MTQTAPTLASAGLSFIVHGTPRPQGSKRLLRNPYTGKVAMVESSRQLGPWRDSVVAAARGAMGDLTEPLQGPVRLSVVCSFARPKSHYRAGKNAHLLRDGAPRAHTGKPDMSKLVRAVEDALTDAGVIRDDAQINSLVAVKEWIPGPSTCLVVVRRGDA